MHIWVDGDACPRAIKDILFRAAARTKTPLTLVSNHPLLAPASPFIKRWQVGTGLDSVDHYITEQLSPGDLIITADIPFADAAVSKAAIALNPRGELYTHQNIKQHLAQRNRNELLRGSNLLRGGPAPLSAQEIQLFANQLDKLLNQRR